MIKHVNSQEFEEIMQDKNGMYVVDFFATWCGPCKMLTPVFESVSEQFPDVTFCKIDIDENMEAAAAMRVAAVPTLLFIRHGEVTARTAGFMDEDELSEFVEENR